MMGNAAPEGIASLVFRLDMGCLGDGSVNCGVYPLPRGTRNPNLGRKRRRAHPPDVRRALLGSQRAQRTPLMLHLLQTTWSTPGAVVRVRTGSAARPLLAWPTAPPSLPMAAITKALVAGAAVP